MYTIRGSDTHLLNELRALGDMCGSQGDFSRAEQHYRLALSLYESSFPERHVDAIVCLLKLVEMLREQGKFNEAQQMEDRIPDLNARRRITEP
jgi:hypothetical protein